MLSLAITVRDGALRVSRDITIRMDEDKPVSLLIENLLSHLEWPTEQLDGRPLIYHMRIERTGQVLSGHEQLGASGILDADIVVLGSVTDYAAFAERSAGATPSSREHALRQDTIAVRNEGFQGNGGQAKSIPIPLASIECHQPGSAPNVVHIGDGETIIGRSDECGVRVDDRAVSRKHARVLYEAPHFWLEDLGSANGTILDEHTVTRDLLHDGATIVVGSTRMVFRRH